MRKIKRPVTLLLCVMVVLASCSVPAIVQKSASNALPQNFGNNHDTSTVAIMEWRTFFTDPYLLNLIDTALANNQDLKITLQEIEIAKNDIRMREQPLHPMVGVLAGGGIDKVGRYTSQGAGDASTDIKPGTKVPDVLTDLRGEVYANWEIDIWKKLRNAKGAAIDRFLASVEGKNFVVTNLVAEVASSYYYLLSLDNQLETVHQNIALQQNALAIVKVQKEASRVTELAVQKFEAEVLKSQSLEFGIRQQIAETENRVHFLTGRYPAYMPRSKNSFLALLPQTITAGIPSGLLANRPDIKQAELELEASRLDVKVARAEFYPSLGITAALGLQAFRPSYLLKLPESMLFSMVGDIAGPLINRNAIKAEFANANARQLQAIYNYERTVLNAFIEVATQLSNISNLQKSYDLKFKQVNALSTSISIANDLFKSARADYFEVLMTQRDALEATLELADTKKEQFNAVVNLYRNLGGGWR